MAAESGSWFMVELAKGQEMEFSHNEGGAGFESGYQISHSVM